MKEKEKPGGQAGQESINHMDKSTNKRRTNRITLVRKWRNPNDVLCWEGRLV